MKKVIVGLTIALLAVGAAGCNKDKKSTPVTAPSAAEEVLASVEANYQRDDPNASDPSTALTCKYLSVVSEGGVYKVKKAEIKTSGRCDFPSLKNSASDAGVLASDKAAAIVNAATSDSTLPASARDKRGCTAINVRTTGRKIGVQDCSENNGNGDSVAKAIAAQLGL